MFGIDRDYLQYRAFFESLSAEYDGRFEVGFVALTLLVKEMGFSFWALLFSSALISLTAKLYLITRLSNSTFWFFVYLLSLYPLHELTQVRVSIALGFGYLALYFSFNKRNGFKAIIFATFSVLFHWTLLVFVPFILFVNVLRRRSLFVIGVVIFAPIIVIFSSLSALSYLNPQVGHMLATAGEMNANPFSSRNLIFLMLVFLGLININKLPVSAIPFLYLSIFGISFWYGMMSIPVFAHRIFELTIFSCFFWISELPKYSKIVAMALFAFLSVYLFINALYFDPLFGPNR